MNKIKDRTQNSVKIKSVLSQHHDNNIRDFLNDKNISIQSIIRNTILSIKINKYNEIFSNNDVYLSENMLNEIYEKTNEIHVHINNESSQTELNKYIEVLQKIIDKLSIIICGFGTRYINDLLYICFGSEFKDIEIENPIIKSKYKLITTHIQPIGYKVINWKTNKGSPITLYSHTIFCSNKITEDIIVIEDAFMFECFDIDSSIKKFHQKILGIRVIIQNEKLRKTIIINGVIDDIHLDCLSASYIEHRKKEILDLASNRNNDVEKQIIIQIVENMTFKDILICGNNDIIKKMITVIVEVNSIKNTKLDIIIKRFLELDVFQQRQMIINLLYYIKDDEIQYICYLLYELLTVNSVDTFDTGGSSGNTHIYESLPFKLKTRFKDLVKYTIKNTSDISQKYDANKITLEQQVYMMKVGDNIKEKAMTKLKEIKGRSEEMGSKAKHYLEGLVKIPFGVYREEPTLRKVKELNIWFENIVSVAERVFSEVKIEKKTKYTTVEIVKHIQYIEGFINKNMISAVEKSLNECSAKQNTQILKYINGEIKSNREDKSLTIKNQSKNIVVKNIIDYLHKKPVLCFDIFDKLNRTEPHISLSKTMIDLSLLKTHTKGIEQTMERIMDVLDESIYGHAHAKNQIIKILAQWMNGEQSGYCFGFEGSPGIGKTSLAKKGLANCLKNDDSSSRPFAFIALGGSSNGSLLEGHGYTYMNSQWGRIADILMESNCMNPIIYIDELDKVSKTENGREIIGILTHLIDSTQNDGFQDKYFSGIDLDLSKALFILSYNDPEQIDHVLLDRIHRIKFDNLTHEDKIVIVNKHLLPELNAKMGFHNVVDFSEDMVEYVIETYTREPGVRKLKEIIFDLYGEINLEILQANTADYHLPLKLTVENISNKYLKKYKKITEQKMHESPQIGVINGLWANTMGNGGIIPIETLFFPSSTFLELKLTGLQGDVMKESMNVAKSLAWKMTPDEKKREWIEQFENTKCQGLHIHCPDGAVSKDGPSAGAAITIAIYSLLNGKQIRNDVAITGEITLQGKITKIGGLDIKINGAFRAGIKTILYPASNHEEYIDWQNKNQKPIDTEIRFVEVSGIEDTFSDVFV